MTCEVGEGKVQGNVAQSSCDSCGAGKKAVAGTTNACVNCPSGKTSLGGSDSCGDCADGSHSDEGSAVCVATPPGFYFESTTNADVQCPAGTFSRSGANNLAGCGSCNDPGQFSSIGSSYCSVAGAGKLPNAARSGVVDCGTNTYSTGASDTCTPCEVRSERGSVYNNNPTSLKTNSKPTQFVSLGAGVQRLRPAPYRRGFLQLLRAREVRRRVHQHVRGLPRLEVLHRRGEFLHKLRERENLGLRRPVHLRLLRCRTSA